MPTNQSREQLIKKLCQRVPTYAEELADEIIGNNLRIREEAIEECAKVAYNFCPKTLGLNHKCAEAIRKLKEGK